ncbi:hypothetical protein BJF84_17745 [Rhodococcus sp. CUA-806]|nr:hypothetical protein BJF84_17745 [Rhodococcus sp. CUA-806]
MSSNTEFMKMYDVWSKHLDAAPFKFVEKFSGDGLHITADSMHAGEVINLAMAMLHEFEKLGATAGGQPMGEIDFQVRAGIATGPAFRFGRSMAGTWTIYRRCATVRHDCAPPPLRRRCSWILTPSTPPT